MQMFSLLRMHFDDLLCPVTAQWYRFTSAVSNRIPETCVEPGHCGTQWPIWMNGQHPTGNF